MTSLGEDLSLKLKVRWDPLSSEVVYDQLCCIALSSAYNKDHLDISLNTNSVE
jgi:hypothetical protein